MAAEEWEDVFQTLDLMEGARISKASLQVAGQPQGGSMQLYAVALDGRLLPIDLGEDEESLTFRLADLELPTTDLVLLDNADQELIRLDVLLPRTDYEFERGFRSKKSRSNDPYVNFFIARQMALHFPGTVSYRVSAAVVVVYKAVEIGDKKYLRWAEQILDTAEELIPISPVARSPRKNREHLRVSLWCAEWHLRLLRGDFEGFLTCLQKVQQYMETATLSTYFNAAYPANRSLCMLCLYYMVLGQREEAERVAELTVSLFQWSVRGADQTLAHFKELSVIHKMAYECLVMIKSRETITEDRAKDVFRNCKRIDASNYSRSFRTMWATAKQGFGFE